MKRRFQAFETYSSPRGKIDRVKGIIFDVKVCGKVSKNKRRYTDEALEDAKGLYENISIYVDHALGKKKGARSVKDHAGVLRNIRRTPDGLRGDLHYNSKTNAGQLVLECADKFPEKFGLSHHAIVDGYEEDGVKVIERIVELRSVDVVVNPATTANIFEAVDMDSEEAPAQTVEAALLALQTAVLGDSSMDDAAKEKWIKKLNKLKTEMTGEADEADEPEAEAEGDGGDDAPPEEPEVKESIAAKILERLTALEAKLEAPAPAKRTPKQAARSSVVESVTTPAKKDAPLPKTKEEVLAAWGVD